MSKNIREIQLWSAHIYIEASKKNYNQNCYCNLFPKKLYPPFNEIKQTIIHNATFSPSVIFSGSIPSIPIYSVFKLFTGFANAAFKAWKLMVDKAMNKENPEIPTVSSVQFRYNYCSFLSYPDNIFCYFREFEKYERIMSGDN